MKYLCFLAVVSVQAAQQSFDKPRPSYIQIAQSMRHQMTAQINQYKLYVVEENEQLRRQLLHMKHHLQTQLLTAKHEHKQYCKKIREEQKKVTALLGKV